MDGIFLRGFEEISSKRNRFEVLEATNGAPGIATRSKDATN